MPVEIRVPPLGESLVDAVVGSWLKSEGDEVSRGETLLELETDKVNLDVTAPENGVLGKIEKQEGDIVTVGELLGVVAEGAAATNGAQPAQPAPAAETAPAAGPSTPEQGAPMATPDSAPAVQAAPQPSQPAAAAPPQPAVEPGSGATDSFTSNRAAPAVRRLAEEHAVNLAQIPGTGPGGRVTREDVLAFASHQQATPQAQPAVQPVTPPAPTPAERIAQPQAPSPITQPPSPTTDRREERVRMSRRRQTIATRLVEAQHTAAMLTTFNEVDMSAVMELRNRRKEAFKERYGVNLGFMSFFTKTVIGALKAFPRVNAEVQGDEIVLKHYFDIGIAVGVEEGLVVPVVRDADRKTFAEIEQEIVELATKARENKLALAELQGGTFTITNGGIFGSLLSTPILNAPQVGILGMHAIQQRPVARDGEVVIRPMMYVALSYDHRIVDGREAVQFLVRVKELLEDPTSLLLDG
ncbi:MAG: 2-oxoglutarate dehydrogenase complex dihydrolipoyllysine-residue succinyltransferase [Thermomicrobiales bacterium]